eukprot:TRINITY_DN45561_c0_g2_i1.p1 TRINITY_DN45561_c0_g2~~TRINITY_DN45561_c0_g2_i1.p1  ORF type:complete len:190 (-),score=28.81 TRINITY_DN45561_c0_g2_i1:172-741(-)
MYNWFGGAVLILASAWPAAANFGHCGAGPVGDCAFLGCLPSRGPTQCVGNQCLCSEGYCEYGSKPFKRCRAEVPESSCHISGMCWKGGVMSSSCVEGHCLCRFGMVIKDGVCSVTGGSSLLGVTNATSIEFDEELDAKERFEVFLNVLGISAWCSIAAGLLALSTAFARRVWVQGQRKVEAALDHRLLA